MKLVFIYLTLSILALWSPLALSDQRVTPSELQGLAEQVSATRIENDIRRLAGFGTRHTLSETESDTRGIGAARRWIKASFETISRDCDNCLRVLTQSRVISGERRIPEPTEVVNVIAILPARVPTDRYVVMSGDIDSRASDPLDGVSDAPGANDNASGMAGAIEAARVLSQYRFDANIVFAGLSGEEQGLFGGQIMAETARDEGWFIQAVLNNDMIGNIRGQNGVINNRSVRVFSEATRPIETPEARRWRRFFGGENDGPSRNLARYIAHLGETHLPNLDVMMIYRLDRFGRGGHHRPFNEVGFPAVRIMETNEHYHRQHQDLRVENGIRYGDTVDWVDFDYARSVTGLNVITLAALATAPEPPRSVSLSGQVSPDTTLKWERVPGAVGYEIHWRLTTDAHWRWSVRVGDVTAHTLKDVVIDNYLFGVSSINKDGMASPVIFPGPIGSVRYDQ